MRGVAGLRTPQLPLFVDQSALKTGEDERSLLRRAMAARRPSKPGNGELLRAARIVAGPPIIALA